ncbi:MULTISPECIES: GNAT family N-acetyltransferase [unclassified Arthrobacter]|uniref:GNAT family N-acetyltransferase n=1 Tax=unclassified Arthrobacter TaxID=235627 RepID=UPI001491DFAF|nr:MULTISPECIES: GNAT family N-acetyltransferase [unclassified Arthrobacter]MBE0008829.1 GNAT family N-acetyltransferase [Arthrobacter sp. AET 35A]NOJ62691.1 GNAT family N-acetyltransferase [Arthrobacter sp. 147(2020)]
MTTEGALHLRPATEADWPALWAIMEPVARAGETYCWDTGLSEARGRTEWLAPADPTMRVYVAEAFVGAEASNGAGGHRAVVGTAQLHANRGGGGAHVANASFMVAGDAGGRGVGRALAAHVLAEAREQGYRAMQFNAVVAANTRAVRLWESLGFTILATVPGAFRHPVEGFVGLHIMFRDL